jgi:hypothetical protein
MCPPGTCLINSINIQSHCTDFTMVYYSLSQETRLKKMYFLPTLPKTLFPLVNQYLRMMS